MAQLQRTRPAEVDLLEIWTYIAEDSVETAEEVLRSIAQKCWDCAEFPGMGRRRDELSPGLRSVVEGRYIVFYRPLEDGIRLMRVIHGRGICRACLIETRLLRSCRLPTQ